MALFLAHPAVVSAQCVMCYLSAGSSGEGGAQALRMGILVLAVPTVLVFAGLFLLAYRRRNPVAWSEATPQAEEQKSSTDFTAIERQISSPSSQ